MVIGIGLVIVGLLAGILITLLATRTGGVGDGRPDSVARVELGARPPSGYVTVPESELPTRYLDALSLNEVFKDVASRVTPAVVFIQVRTSRRAADVFRNFRGDQDRRIPSQSVGSGVIISDQGYVVTNHHVIDGADEIVVTLGDKRQFDASLVGTDPTTDLAVLRIDGPDLPVIALGNADDLEVGEWVLAVGNPFRLTSTVTAGIVSALGRQVNVIEDRLGIESFVQTDAAINPGNSGGAVVNLRGELIGIATAIATETGSYEGYGFAVPVDLMERVVGDLIRYGEVRRGYLGVSILPVTAGVAENFGLNDVRGVLLSEVRQGLAGADAGLEAGDILLEIDGRAVSEPNELQSAIAMRSPGDLLDVLVWRNGEVRDFEVMLKGKDDPGYRQWLTGLNQDGAEEAPAPEPEAPDAIREFENWGIGLADMNERLRRRFETPHGAYLAFVENGSAFDRSGLTRGLIIVRINDQEVFDVESASDLFEESEGSVFIEAIRSDGVRLFFEVEASE
ncbi:MAG: trypsin-like serine protease [Rhodothermales bacterium]|nr:trypsin-like serine protease [Rhodothermales bacterium]